MSSIAELLAVASTSGREESRLEAEVLLAHCLGQSRTYLYTWPEQEVDADSERRFRELLHAREAGRPVAYLTGSREFWSLDLQVSEHTLIPRPDTETLVEWALQLNLPAQARVLDLGTGTGAIALALASERPNWELTATDCSAEALAMAESNAETLKLPLRCLQSDWGDALLQSQERFDLVVSNPPYIEEADPHLDRGDLRFEPRSALASGADGLDDIRTILARAPALLNRGGYLLLEHGFQQAAAVCQLLREAGFSGVQSKQDLAGHDRISGGRL